eukprot:GFUD01027242.1.p1 GENE.GFUD01027242.1~~GFUD01027242.1.p1  ORF type:complete len:329 (+),score=143.43 GFUD01027242.1:52-1038(+)
MTREVNAPELAWLEELNLLTKFHPNNVGFSVLGRVKEEDDEQAEENVEEEATKSKEAFKQKVRGIGRGSSRIASQDDSCYIARQIEQALGSGHRAGSVFNSSKTSTKSEVSADNNPTQETPVKETGTADAEQNISVRTKLVKKNSSSSASKASALEADQAEIPKVGLQVRKQTNKQTPNAKAENHDHAVGKGVAKAMKDAPSPRGRGRGRRMSDHPQLAVATMIQQKDDKKNDDKKKDDKKDDEEKKAKKSNNNNMPKSNNKPISYFPTFDYESYGKMCKPSAWWASSMEMKSEYEPAQINYKQEEEQESVVVERAVMTKWTPLDDSV